MNILKTVTHKLDHMEGLAVLTVYLLLLGAFAIAAPGVFTQYRIYMSFLETVPPLLILALGLTIVVAAGEIDMSFSAVIGWSGLVFAAIFRTFGMPWLAFSLAILAGALVGFINGLLVAKLRIPSIMATLATQFFWRGVTVLVCGGLSWNIKAIRPYFIHTLFVGRIGGIVPAQSIWAIGVAILLWFILNRHKFGENVLFTGDNANVGKIMGVNVVATKIMAFTLMGALSGFAAVLLTLDMINFWTTQGQGFLLPTMAAVFIGGTSLSGGAGSIVGTFFGAYIIGSLEAGVVASGIGGYWVHLVTGVVMGVSILANIKLAETKGNQLALSARLKQTVLFRGLGRKREK